jgi:hypothetical protein
MRKMLIALGAAATLLTLGSTAAQASVNHARPDATPACGFNCFELSSLILGPNQIQNVYNSGANGTGGKVGQDVNLKGASNTRPNEDFTGAQVGVLADYCGGLISAESYVCINYPSSYPVFESNWSPFGNESGLCVGIATPGYSGENATMQNCGVSAATLWVGDLKNATSHHGHLYTPWVNASDPNFSHPLVLTVEPGTSRPDNQLKVERLNTLTGGVSPDTQEFTLHIGPVA